jgi:retron-type reverse transcriptase
MHQTRDYETAGLRDNAFPVDSKSRSPEVQSIITQLTRQETWEAFLAYRLMKGRFNWHEFDEADAFVEREAYLPIATKIAEGEGLGIPTKKLVNKMGSGKKRVVYSFAPDEMLVLKLIAFLLYKYDDQFAPNCYAFRRGVKAHDAVFNINKAIKGQKMWAYKLDIHDYFNSIDIDLLLPMLKEMLADDPPLYQFFEKLLTQNFAISNGQVIEEKHGVMAGTPTAPFLADVYLKEVDRYYYNKGVVYARYSDDIIMFAPDYETLEGYKKQMCNFLAQAHLEVNPDKEKIYTPDEAYEFLGFKCHGRDIDISEATKKKMKGKISRQARALLRWKNKKGLDSEKAMKALINYFNRKFFESDDPETLTWSRWFFPVITQTDGLKEIDHYLQQNIRFLSTGKHNKTNYKTDYAQLKAMGYRSLVNEYYKYIQGSHIPNGM